MVWDAKQNEGNQEIKKNWKRVNLVKYIFVAVYL